MSMTITEKILARHADLDEVRPGMLINARVDIALGNDITAPIAIDVFRKAGATKVFDRDRIVLVPDHFAPNKDIESAEQCKIMRDFAREHQISHYFEIGEAGVEHALVAGEGDCRPRGSCRRRRQPHLHLWGSGGLLHRRREHRSRRGDADRRALVQDSGDDEVRLPRKIASLGGRQRSDPTHDRPDRRGRGALPGDGVHRRGDPGAPDVRPPDDGEHGDRGGRKKRDLHPGCDHGGPTSGTVPNANTNSTSPIPMRRTIR